MNKRLKNILQYSFFLGLGIFLTWWQYNKMTPGQKADFSYSIRHAHYWVVIPVFIMSVLSHLSRAARWRILMEPLGYRPRLSYSFATVMIGYLVNTLLPRVGEVAKCTLLGKREKIPVDKLVGTILIERTVDLFSYFVIIGITVLLQFQRVGDVVAKIFTDLTRQSRVHPVIKVTVFIAGLVLLYYVMRWFFRKYSHNKFVTRIKGVVLGLKAGFVTIRRIRHKGWFLAHTIFIWTMYLLQIQVGFMALDYTAHLGLDAAFATLTLGTLAMIVTPGGIGAFPIAVAAVLGVFLTGNKEVVESNAQSFGWIMWGASTGIVLIVGLLCFIWYEIQIHKRHAPDNRIHTA